MAPLQVDIESLLADRVERPSETFREELLSNVTHQLGHRQRANRWFTIAILAAAGIWLNFGLIVGGSANLLQQAEFDKHQGLVTERDDDLLPSTISGGVLRAGGTLEVQQIGSGRPRNEQQER